MPGVAGIAGRLRLFRATASSCRRSSGRLMAQTRARRRDRSAACAVRARALRRRTTADRPLRRRRGFLKPVVLGAPVDKRVILAARLASGQRAPGEGSAHDHTDIAGRCCHRGVVVVFATSSLAQERVFFGIATGGTGGTYYPLGGMLAQLISQQGDDRRQEAVGHRRDRGRLGRQRAAPRAQGHRERVRRRRHPRRRVQRQGPVRRQAGEEPARARRAVPRAGAARHARHRRTCKSVQGPEGQVGVVGLAGIGPVAAAGRPARGARHDAQGHRRGPVVVHAVGRQDQGRQPDRVADHRRCADVVDHRSRQRARHPHRSAGRSGDRGPAQEAAVLRERPAAGQHLQGPGRRRSTRSP